MSEVFNLKNKIETTLPLELVDLMRTAGELAHKQGQNLYLVGGIVRDLISGRTNLDLDLVLEGNAIRLARRLKEMKRGKLKTHPHFGTAKLEWNGFSIDLTTARSETYSKPGALPKTRPGKLADDLARRDFSVNAMAASLSPSRFGELVDLHKGRNDLENRLIRVLHEKSFIDDATRIWRGIRYEQRLNFKLGKKTLKLLKRDVPMLDTISGDRIRYELECVFKEGSPEKVLHRAEELGVLTKLHPSLRAGGRLAEQFASARKSSYPDLPSFELYLAIFAYILDNTENEGFISYLNLPRKAAKTLRDSDALKSKLTSLAQAEVKPSQIYQILHGYTQTSVIANLITTKSPLVYQNIQLFLDKLCNVRTALGGEDLMASGISGGPNIKEVLELLLKARLDGKVKTKGGEEELVKRWLAAKR